MRLDQETPKPLLFLNCLSKQQTIHILLQYYNIESRLWPYSLDYYLDCKTIQFKKEPSWSVCGPKPRSNQEPWINPRNNGQQWKQGCGYIRKKIIKRTIQKGKKPWGTYIPTPKPERIVSREHVMIWRMMCSKLIKIKQTTTCMQCQGYN